MNTESEGKKKLRLTGRQVAHFLVLAGDTKNGTHSLYSVLSSKLCEKVALDTQNEGKKAELGGVKHECC